MKVPGEAILDFQMFARPNGETELVQTAWFVPRGLLGILYWLLVTPLHGLVFRGMLNGIARAAGVRVVQPPTPRRAETGITSKKDGVR